MTIILFILNTGGPISDADRTTAWDWVALLGSALVTAALAAGTLRSWRVRRRQGR